MKYFQSYNEKIVNEKNELSSEIEAAKAERKAGEKNLKDFTKEYSNLVFNYGKNYKKKNINDGVKKKALEVLNNLIKKYNIDYDNFTYEPKFFERGSKIDNSVGHKEIQTLYKNSKKIKDIGVDTPINKEIGKISDSEPKEEKQQTKVNPLEQKIKSRDVLPILSTKLANQELETVKYIQQRLNIEDNGYYDNNTKEAVKNYQTENGLTPDGIVGKNTWSKLLGKVVKTAQPKVKSVTKTTGATTDDTKTTEPDDKGFITDLDTIKKLFDSIQIKEGVRIIKEQNSEKLGDDILKDVKIKVTDNEIEVYYKNKIVKSAAFKKIGKFYEFADSSDKDIIMAEIWANKEGIVTESEDIQIVINKEGKKIPFSSAVKKMTDKFQTASNRTSMVGEWIMLNKETPKAIKELRNKYLETTNDYIEMIVMPNLSGEGRISFSEALLDNIKDDPQLISNLLFVAIDGIGTMNRVMDVLTSRLSKYDANIIKKAAEIYKSEHQENIIDAIKGEEDTTGEFYNLTEIFKNALK